jgi:hypothetical protein
MLDLSRVTLLFVETRAHKITERVIADCLSKADFGDVLIYTDQPDLIRVDANRRGRIISCPDFPNKREAGRFYYSEAMSKVYTDFALMLEWDAGIFDPAKWRPEFFDYDYIGAPWPRSRHQPNAVFDVGNGGFTLMSRGLGEYICRHAEDFPVFTDMDVCRVQRGVYEAFGFKWPKAELASCFAWELGYRNPDNFGFHGAFRWIDMLSREELVIRAKLMTETPYLLSKMKDVFRYDEIPWLEAELGAEAWAKWTAVREPRRGPSYVAGRPRGYVSPQQRAAMNLMQAQRRGLIAHRQNTGLKA